MKVDLQVRELPEATTTATSGAASTGPTGEGGQVSAQTRPPGVEAASVTVRLEEGAASSRLVVPHQASCCSEDGVSRLMTQWPAEPSKGMENHRRGGLQRELSPDAFQRAVQNHASLRGKILYGQQKKRKSSNLPHGIGTCHGA